MYATSNAFHEAVAAGNEQMPLLVFDNAVFTASDINVDKGITFNDYFNLEEDLSIGQALSNELQFSIFNDHGYLDDYEFGEFTALLGVHLSSTTYTQQGTIYVRSESNTYVANASVPYITRNGTALAAQPSGQLANILIYNGFVYCFQKNGSAIVYNDSTGAAVSKTIPNFMKQKFRKAMMRGAFYNNSTNVLTINMQGTRRTYEFVPLGRFIADRPNVPTVNEIDFSCNDFMMKFEKDMPSDSELGITFPATIGTLFVKMCQYVGVSYRTSTFINSTATISKRPDEFETATMRDVLKWIAEAAGGNAKFDRDGYLGIEWVRATEQTFGPNMYKSFNPYWYETTKVTKLENRASDGSYDKTSGAGDETYLIQDNPLLRGVE